MMRFILISNLFLVLILGCHSKNQFQENNKKLILLDSLNLDKSGSYLISDFNYAKVDSERTIIVDLFGGQLFGLINGKEKFYQLDLKDVDLLEGNLQVGNIAFTKEKRFLYFPNLSKIVELDINNKFVRNIYLSSDNDITADKFNSLFEFDEKENLFYLTLYRDSHKSLQYSDVPLIGVFNLEGELIESLCSYPENYRNFRGDLSAWKFSFFDKDKFNYYAVFNRNNKIFQYDYDFTLVNTIKLPPNFIATENYQGKILNSFKKHPTENIFYVVENEEIEDYKGRNAVKIKFKWFNADTGEYGHHLLPNYMRIHQVTEEGSIILLDRNSKEDTYLNFYEILSKENV